ncbi:alpha/beta hydrolase [Deinococcus sonorensis]|uniref:Alpha/beta hydrolase n=2 Tax=Deinococcus sonorensis TaxID=309891 RepID=A0AAU7U6W0_9DEIO
MFQDFALEMIELPEATLRVRHGGSGPPLLLWHGHPRTHTTWHRVAPMLAQHFTVVCPDLRGFGRSSKPADQPHHEGSSKRAKARDSVALMRHLGFETFNLAGHDRGSYTAFRTAMDHPGVVTRLAVLDSVPLLEALERCDAKFAQAWWHWFFFAQPEKPERAILQDPNAWYRHSPTMATEMGPGNYEDYQWAIHDPETVHGMVEDYRAGLTIDQQHDREDRTAGRRLQCPTLVLWSEQDDLAELYGDVLNVWRPWTTELSGHSIASGHHMAEEAPDQVAETLINFFLDQQR